MNRRIYIVVALLVMAGMFAGALAQQPPKPKKLSNKEQALVDAKPLGSMQNPVRCSKMAGAKEYIARLRCATGKAPKAEYNGAVGQGPYGTNMEYFRLTCKSEDSPLDLFLDPNHKDFVEELPIPGFTIVKPKGK